MLTLHCPPASALAGSPTLSRQCDECRMPVRLFVSILALLASVSSMCPGVVTNATTYYVEEFTPGYCAFIRRPIDYNRETATMFEVDDLCRRLRSGYGRWYLPKLDNIRKQADLEAMIKRRFGWTMWAAWIGLKRKDVPGDRIINTTAKRWLEPSKWLWRKDDTSLLDSYPRRDAPWDKGTPAAVYLMSGIFAECVIVIQLIAGITRWQARPCDLRMPGEREVLQNQLIVCEAEVLPNTTVSAGTQSSQTPNATNGKKTVTFETPGYLFHWQWILLGVSLALVVASFAIIATICIVKHQLEKKKRRPDRRNRTPSPFSGRSQTQTITTISRGSARSVHSFLSFRQSKKESKPPPKKDYKK